MNKENVQIKTSTVNNFDLIRLFAASQVAVTHAATHLGYHNPIIEFLYVLPGVPIFFFISGFLIYSSYEKSLTNQFPLRNFFIKRALRLYPALFFCFVFSIFLVEISGYFTTVEFSVKEFSVWTFTQLTFFQFFNPDFLRGYGEGSLNGSLWTISTELQFYFLTPVVYFFFRKKLGFTLSIIIFFCMLNMLNVYLNDQESIIEKLVSVSFAPWLYMFLLGAFIATRSDLLEKILKLNFFTLIVGYVALQYLSKELGLGWGNKINPFSYIFLVALTLKIAFTNRTLSDRILKRNDISYGIYIFHMPIINFLMYKGIGINSINGFSLAIVITIIISIISWFFIEKPAMRLKRSQLRAS